MSVEPILGSAFDLYYSATLDNVNIIKRSISSFVQTFFKINFKLRMDLTPILLFGDNRMYCGFADTELFRCRSYVNGRPHRDAIHGTLGMPMWFNLNNPAYLLVISTCRSLRRYVKSNQLFLPPKNSHKKKDFA